MSGRTYHDWHFSVDGIELSIQYPTPFDSKWYLRKVKHAGLSYESGISIFDGEIVLISGWPFEWRSYSYLKYFTFDLTKDVEPFEGNVSDYGYENDCFLSHGHLSISRGPVMLQSILPNNEKCNGRLKEFHIFEQSFDTDGWWIHNVSIYFLQLWRYNWNMTNNSEKYFEYMTSICSFHLFN